MSGEAKPAAPETDNLGLAGSALLMTTGVAVAAKVAGVLVAPGARGVLSGKLVELVETLSGACAYTLTALLVALICTSSFELARTRAIRTLGRGTVVAVTGLIVALASPAVVERLSTIPSLALAAFTSAVVLVAGLVILRGSGLRAVSAVLLLLAASSLSRIVAYELSAASFERVSIGLHNTARVVSTLTVATQAVAVLIGAAWIGTRARWKGRILANGAILVAFALTWLAGRAADEPSTLETLLRASLPAAASITPPPYFLGSIAVFLVPASILLAGVGLALREEPALIVAPLALALLSNGVFDVPLQALLATAGAQWAMLALVATPRRAGAPQPMSPPSFPAIGS